MQIRAANKQDEPIIRTIIFQAMEENGATADIEGRDSDLKNVEHNYFWYDGLCIVAERDGQIIGVLAARRNEKDENTLEIMRLAVTPGARKRGAARALVKTMLFFAGNMEYKQVRAGVSERGEDLKRIDPLILKKLGFTQEADGTFWTMTAQSASCSSGS
ncbi:MAG: GNAT family N-acetyltransferase [Candidatus Obscuribacterales bacterium]|jgi:predicted N-acetyltransferase YhbS|nr:GNAT family N-acetyltransferase [Candidatus Obscuribacterales bacterium]